MANGPDTSYPHRHNSNDSWDSICPLCFRTVGREKTEGALHAEEETHDCGALEVAGDSKFPSMQKPAMQK
jgi:hypothetical protein